MPSPERFASTWPVSPRLGCDAGLGTQGDWKILVDEMIGQLLHLGRIGAARVQHGAARRRWCECFHGSAG